MTMSIRNILDLILVFVSTEIRTLRNILDLILVFVSTEIRTLRSIQNIKETVLMTMPNRSPDQKSWRRRLPRRQEEEGSMLKSLGSGLE